MKGTNEFSERNEHNKVSSKKAAKIKLSSKKAVKTIKNSSVIDESTVESTTLAHSFKQDFEVADPGGVGEDNGENIPSTPVAYPLDSLPMSNDGSERNDLRRVGEDNGENIVSIPVAWLDSLG